MKKLLYLSLLVFGLTVCKNIQDEQPALLRPEPDEHLAGGAYLTTNDHNH